MTWVFVGIAVLLVVLALWLSWTANRLDRMHHRIDLARSSWETQLQHRSGVALEVALDDRLDPASRLVMLDAASTARQAGVDEVVAAESALSEVLRRVFEGPDETRELAAGPELGPLLVELALACRKVELARRIHNDVVVAARSLRARRRVRWLHLAGHAAALRTVDLDDVPPAGLVALAGSA